MKKEVSQIVTGVSLIVVVLLVLFVFFNALPGDQQHPNILQNVRMLNGGVGGEIVSSEGEVGEKVLVEVVRVVDGDTVVVRFESGREETVRLIGINTPETVDFRKPVECFGREASVRAKEVLAGQRVTLKLDGSQDQRDKYGRLLAYVFLPDGQNFNKLMIAEGYAYEYTYFLPYKYQDEFKEVQRLAEVNNRGLWAPGVCDQWPYITPSGEELVPREPVVINSRQFTCQTNTYNCADFNSKAEAHAVFEACGGPVYDTHLLDRDRDGLACEMWE